MGITVICVGKIKEPYLKGGLAEYQKRLGRFCALKITEVPDLKIPDGASAAQKEQIRQREGREILRKIKKGDYVIALCIEGEAQTSERFAQTMARITDASRDIAFIIGGSLGLSDEVKTAADRSFSLSGMTFPHQLARLILLEQLYRAFKINAKETYHK